MKKGFLVGLLVLVVLIGGVAYAQEKGTVYYLSPNQFDEYQTAARWAIEKYVGEAGYNVVTLVAGSEDLTIQLNQMDDILTQDPVAIIVNAVNGEAIAPTLEKARSMGIPIVVFDRVIPVTYADFTCAFDCKALGRLAGEETARLLKEKYGEVRGLVLDLMGDPGDMFTVLMEDGFREVMGQYPEVEINTKIAYEWSATTGANITEDWLLVHPDTDLIFTHADTLTPPIATILEMKGYEPGDVLIVSTCGMPVGLNLVREGWCQSTINILTFAEGAGVAMFLDKIVDRQCPKPGTYTLLGYETTLSCEDSGPQLLLGGAPITSDNVDNPNLWGNFKEE